MQKKWTAVALALLFLIAGFLVLYQQYVNFGVWFQIEDIHHETIALALFGLGIGTLIGISMTGKNQK
jgi:predicted MFS family arabinose efflux permease